MSSYIVNYAQVTSNILGRKARNQKGICVISRRHRNDGNKNTGAVRVSLVGTKDMY